MFAPGHGSGSPEYEGLRGEQPSIMTTTAEAKGHLSTTVRALAHGSWVTCMPPPRASIAWRCAVVTPGSPRPPRRSGHGWKPGSTNRYGPKPSEASGSASRDDFRREVEKQAAYTLLNRLVILRLMEAAGLRSPAVVTGGWESRAYQDFRQLAPALVRGDESEGYAFLLQLVFEDLADDLPGLYGPAGVADLVPVPVPTLRYVVEALDDKELATCWTDDMTLGWVYQFWNDPEREEIDKKLDAGGKVEPYEIASKTQMFTERYMVDWLLQNSLGPMWLAMCRKHGWTPEVQADGTLDRLEERRAQWRAKREAGEVSLTELMPLDTDAERHWAYYVPQPIPDDAVQHAPESVREIKLFDPALGSGHFHVVAFDLLVALYREEARHRRAQGEEEWSDRAIVERILEYNLYGLDLDPRAVQIAAAALWLKAKQTCPEAHPRHLNLVASNLRLGDLRDDDPALVELRRAVEQDTGIPSALTDALVHALKGADHLGSLLKIDAAVDEAISRHEIQLQVRRDEGLLFAELRSEQQQLPFDRAETRATVLNKLEEFLGSHTGGDDLGLRLRGEQLAAGVRFVRMLREGTYDLVVSNPPYQGTSKIQDAAYVKRQYSKGKADLYAAFLERGLQLVREGGTSALLTMRNWMFIKQYLPLRTWLLDTNDLRALGDFDRGAFEEVLDELVAVVVSVIRRSTPLDESSVALQPTPVDDRVRDNERTQRKRAATVCHNGIYRFATGTIKAIPKWPVVYWWKSCLLQQYIAAEKLGNLSPAKKGLCTGNDLRFLKFVWEVSSHDLYLRRSDMQDESAVARAKEVAPMYLWRKRT